MRLILYFLTDYILFHQIFNLFFKNKQNVIFNFFNGQLTLIFCIIKFIFNVPKLSIFNGCAVSY